MAYRSNRAAEAATLLAQAGAAAAEMGATFVLRAVDDLATVIRGHGGPADSSWAPLTTREFEVALLVCAGRTNRQIAAELHITARTAATHVEHILTKLGVARRAEIAAWVVSVQSG